MWKMSVAAAAVLAALAVPAHALEIKNTRAVYGPFGPDRTDNRFLPGDFLFVTFDIADIQVDPKTNMAKYQIVMEMVDSKGSLVFSRNKTEDVALSLGGGQLPGFADILIGTDQPAGKYTLKVTVKDIVGKSVKVVNYGFEVEPEGFGFVRVALPAAAFTGQSHILNFAVIGMSRDTKKMPNVTIHMHVLDDSGKTVYEQSSMIPKDLPEEEQGKIAASPFTPPLTYGMFLNRPGRFIIELEGTDNLSKKSAKVRFPLTVVDSSSLTSK
jgi:hypothetical protein